MEVGIISLFSFSEEFSELSLLDFLRYIDDGGFGSGSNNFLKSCFYFGFVYEFVTLALRNGSFLDIGVRFIIFEDDWTFFTLRAKSNGKDGEGIGELSLPDLPPEEPSERPKDLLSKPLRLPRNFSRDFWFISKAFFLLDIILNLLTLTFRFSYLSYETFFFSKDS